MRDPSGSTPGIPPTGRQVVWESCDYVKLDGGRLRAWHTYFDQVAFLVQLGLMPAPASA
jgi:hypothetical protein